MRYIVITISHFFYLSAFAQMPDTLSLSVSEAEQLLLDNSLAVLAHELNVEIARAEEIQAAIWPNPSLTIDEVNPFTTAYQRAHAEDLNARLGRRVFSNYQQFSIQLEQLVELAGKRKKRIAIAQVNSEQVETYLEDFLLSLKTEFRKSVYDYYYHQEYLKLLKEEQVSLRTIVAAYARQKELGNIDKTRLIRLKSSEMKLRDKILEQETELNKLYTELAVLLNLPENSFLRFTTIVANEYSYKKELKHPLQELQLAAQRQNPRLRAVLLEAELLQREYKYEKSLSVPDLNLSISYDRNSGIYPDFLGVGLSIELPFIKPNKGDIQVARMKIEQHKYEMEIELRRLVSEVQRDYQKVVNLSEYLRGIDEAYLRDLDETMQVYTRNFRIQAIGIVEFLDFMETFIENKVALLDKQRDYFISLEELRYATGIEDIFN